MENGLEEFAFLTQLSVISVGYTEEVNAFCR